MSTPAKIKTPKNVYARLTGGVLVYYVIVTIDGCRVNLGTFTTPESAEDARDAYILRDMEQRRLKRTSATAASLERIKEAVQTEIVTEQYAPEQLADWLEQLSYVDPTTLVAGKDYGLVHDVTGESLIIPGSVVTLAYNKRWGLDTLEG